MIQVGRWTELNYLNLRNNKVKVLPKTIRQWTKLRSLLLGVNSMSEMPPEVEVMTELVELEMRKNSISQVRGRGRGGGGCPRLCWIGWRSIGRLIPCIGGDRVGVVFVSGYLWPGGTGVGQLHEFGQALSGGEQDQPVAGVCARVPDQTL